MSTKTDSTRELHERLVLSATTLMKEILNGNRCFLDAQLYFAQLTQKESTGESSPVLHTEVIHKLLDSIDCLSKDAGIRIEYLYSIITDLEGIDCKKENVNPNEVGSALVAEQAVNAESWLTINEILFESNFTAAYRVVEKHIKDVQEKTGHLVVTLQETSHMAHKGTSTKHLIMLRPINVMVDFAQLRTAWNVLYEVTLAIELCSRECCYHLRNYAPVLLFAAEV